MVTCLGFLAGKWGGSGFPDALLPLKSDFRLNPNDLTREPMAESTGWFRQWPGSACRRRLAAAEKVALSESSRGDFEWDSQLAALGLREITF